ncbi:MAG: branched-chain amino acid ABC transporter permease [Chloroflexota bacterium]
MLGGWLGLGLTVLIVLSPFVVGPYWLRNITEIMMFVALTVGINLIAGYTGYAAFGNVMFFGIGAYAVAVLEVQFHQSFFAGMLFAVVLSAAFAWAIGYPVLRIKGHYFAIATLGINGALLETANNLGLTNGAAGLSVKPLSLGPGIPSPVVNLWLMTVVAAIAMAINLAVDRSSLGYAFRAIRANEEGAAIVGIRVAHYKQVAWTLSAVVSALAGGVYSNWQGFIQPSDVFDIVLAVQFFVMMLLGGAGTSLGPFVGAVLVEVVSIEVWSHFLTLHLLILGLLIVLMVLFMPGGAMSLIPRLRAWRVGPVKGQAVGGVETSP